MLLLSLITFIIIFILCLFLFLFFKSNRTKNKEHFKNKNTEEIKQKYENDLIDYSGTEACDYLKTENVEMEQKTIDTMHAVLNGFRLNKWKPSEKEGTRMKEKKDKKYCYLYDDDENNMKDLMMIQGCDSFKNNEIISDTFTTNYVDRTHTIPIKKCVLEIDPKKLVNSNINDFWKTWEQNRCEYLTTRYKKEIKDEQKAFDELTNEYAILSSNNATNEIYIKELNGNENLCLNSNVNLRTSIEELHNTNETLLNVLSDKLKTQYDLSDHYDESKEKRRINEENLDVNKNLCNKWTTSNSICQNQYKECEREQYLMNEYLLNEEKMYGTNTSNNKELMTECNVIFQKYNDITGPYEKCVVDLGFVQEERDRMKEALTKQKGIYDTCVVQRELLDKEYEARLNLYKKMKNDEETCIKNRKLVREENKACGITNQRCETLRAEEDRIKKELSALENKLRDCENSKLENIKTIQNSEQINVTLYNDLEKLLQSTYIFEKDVYNNENKQNAQLSSQLLNNHVKEIQKLTAQRLSSMDCGNKKASVAQVNDMDNQNSYLEYQINMLSNQNCAYCIPTVAQCDKLFHDNDVLCSKTPWPSGTTVTSYKNR